MQESIAKTIKYGRMDDTVMKSILAKIVSMHEYFFEIV